ncbi:MAG: GDSL-type esterase/lipase family protein [Thermoanaerobaculia bacterium]
MIRHGSMVLAAALAVAAPAGAQTFGYCAFGDSITCGKYDTENKSQIGPCADGSVSPLHGSAGYAARLRQPARLNCPVDGSGGCMVYNYGKPGEKTGAGLTRLDNVLPQQNFDVLLLMHGTNDVWNNISNNTIKANLQAMEDKARARGVDTVFASIIHYHPNGPKGHSKDAQVESLKNDLSVIAANRGRWFANPWGVLCPGSTCFNQHYALGGVETTGLHPDASGYNILANAFQTSIQQAPVPAAPSLQAPAGGTITTSSEVSWAPANQATWYQVQWDGGAGDRWLDGRAVCNATTCSWTIPNLATGESHTWRVRARNPRGRGAWSATRSFSLVTSLPGIELTFQPGSRDFGVVEVGSSGGPLSATLVNTGELQVTGIGFGLSGGGFSASTGGCPGTLNAGASCSVSATFAPAGAGPAAARLVVTGSHAVRAELDLAGRGVAEGAGLKPVSLLVQPAGNGVFEPGENVSVAPGWRNDEPTAQSLQGTASGYGGPAGATYTLVSDDASYGDIGPGQIRTCQATGNCYGMAVSDPASRPALHWDASFQETLSGGEAKTWSLHIGDSFLDVPRTNPFYTHVEGVLHNGVTAGCGSSQFCPNAVNDRAQIAVFLLKAAEGAGYTPPPCTPGAPLFGDVPVSSPFCQWIEELVGRGVTAGCGGGNYCPSDAVTRASMAALLLKTREGIGYVPPSCKGLFADVPCPSASADWIEELYDRGVAAGCATSPLRYCPGQPVTRAQMAAFLVNTFGLKAYRP